MLDPKNEGRAYAGLKTFLESYETDLKYSFQDRQTAAAYLKAFRYSQPAKKSGMIKLYPEQLRVLARYYMYSDEKKKTYDETKALMTEWLHVLEKALNVKPSEKGGVDRINTENFRVPLSDHSVPLRVIISEGEFAGSFGGNDRYPDPTGLPLLGGGIQEKPGSEEELETFWKYQLASLTVRYMKNSDIPTEALTQRVSVCSVTKEVYTAFVLMLWFARRSGELKSSVHGEGGIGEETFFAINKDRLMRTFMEFTTPGGFEKFCGFFRDFIEVKKAEEFGLEYVMRFRYEPYSPAADETVRRIVKNGFITLPDITELDDGFRIYDTNTEYYGLNLKNLNILLKGSGMEVRLINRDVMRSNTLVENGKQSSQKNNSSVSEVIYTLSFDEKLRSRMEGAESPGETADEAMRKHFLSLKKKLRSVQKKRGSPGNADALLTAAGLGEFVNKKAKTALKMRLAAGIRDNFSGDMSEFVEQFSEVLDRAYMMSMALYGTYSSGKRLITIEDDDYYMWKPAKYLTEKRITLK